MKLNIGLNKGKWLMFFMACAAVGLFGSCDKTKSYSELLTEEEHAVNWYLAQQQVALNIPADGKFETGPKAPFYKMDKDGYVYMQVLNPGESDNRPQKGERIYFRFMRMNLLNLMNSGVEAWVGNAEDMGSGSANVYLIYGNKVFPSTTQYGEGIQVPLEYLGYNSEVNLVIKSPEGFTEDMSSCTPYLYNIRYFKAEY